MNNIHNNPPSYERRPLNPFRKRAIESFSGDSILDVGCGNGIYVNFFANGKKIQGIDLNPSDGWHENPSLFSIGEASQLKAASKSVDTILAFEVLEHLQDPTQALNEFRRVAKKNIIITVPNCYQTLGMKESNLAYGHYVDPTHINFWDKKTLIELLDNLEIEILHFEYINYINLLPLFSEALGFKRNGWAQWFISQFLGVKYPMTLLAVLKS